MLPPDVANALRPVQPELTTRRDLELQATVATQRVVDALSDLAPGQRIMAEIQALLPNGSYRAQVAQREITLALPFSAKPGDTLELEVIETDGKLTLAFVGQRPGQAGSDAQQESVSTTLSQTGRLIGNLIQDEAGTGEQKAASLPLNGLQPLMTDASTDPATLAQHLKSALMESGFFYESHQARWVRGEVSTEQLLREPQGQRSPNLAQLQAEASQLKGPGEPATNTTMLSTRADANPLADIQPAEHAGKVAALEARSLPPPLAAGASAENSGPLTGSGTDLAARTAAGTSPIAPDLAPIVRQQLDALATQQFAWQGQAWPGQPMQWHIEDFGERARSVETDAAQRWQTRLNLSLPHLGDFEARIQLTAGGQFGIQMTATQAEALKPHLAALESRFQAAGLNLTQLTVRATDHEP